MEKEAEGGANKLPPELIEWILSFLDESSLRKCRTVCKSWRNLCKGDLLRRKAPLVERYSDLFLALGVPFLDGVSSLRVLLSSSIPLSIEIARHLVVAGVGSITLCESEGVVISPEDLNANIFLTAADLGKVRAPLCASKLAALNRWHSDVHVISGSLKDSLTDYNVVIIPDGLSYTWPTLCEISNICHSHVPFIPFFVAHYTPFASQIFVDFGPNWRVENPDTEVHTMYLTISSLTIDLDHSMKIALQNYCFSQEFFGDAINQHVRIRLKDGRVLGPFRLSDKLGNCFNHNSAAVITIPNVGEEVAAFVRELEKEKLKQAMVILTTNEPAILHHVPLAEIPFPRECEEPFPMELFKRQDDTEYRKQAHSMISDFTKTGYPYKIHLIFMALSQFLERHENLPAPNDKGQLDEFVRLVFQLRSEVNSDSHLADSDEIDKISRVIAKTAHRQFAPSCSVIGGLLAQEVFKVTGQHNPLLQQLFFHESLNIAELNDDDTSTLIGSTVEEKIREMTILLDGVSPQNVEAAKCLALLGACKAEFGGRMIIAHSGKKLTWHRIPRNFFGDYDLGVPLYEAITHLLETRKMGYSSIEKQNDVPIEQLDKDVMAIHFGFCGENTSRFQAGLLELCKPMVKSRIFGTKAEIGLTAPPKTRGMRGNYGRIYPHHHYDRVTFGPVQAVYYLAERVHIVRGVQLLRDALQQNSDDLMRRVNSAAEPEELGIILAKAEDLLKVLFVQKLSRSPLSTANAIIGVLIPAAIRDFDYCFYHSHKDSVGENRFLFDLNESLHVEFLYSAVMVTAYLFGVDVQYLQEHINYQKFATMVTNTTKTLDMVSGPTFVELEDALTKVKSFPFDSKTLRQFPTKRSNVFRRIAEGFLLTGGELLSKLHGTQAPSLWDVKHSLSVYPRLSTVASIVGGLQVTQMIKYLQDKPMDEMRVFSIDLANNLWKSSCPAPPFTTNNSPGQDSIISQFSEWDFWEIRDRPDMTIMEFCEHFKVSYNLTVSMISSGANLIYISLFPNHAKYLHLKLIDRYKAIKFGDRNEFPLWGFITIDTAMEDLEEKEVSIPTIRFYF